MADQVKQIFSSRQRGLTDMEKKSSTVFSALLESDLPPEELSLVRLQHEAISITGAGIETTMRALSVTCFHLLANPAVLQQLRAELDQKMPDPGVIASYDELAQLPFLSSCIEEGSSSSACILCVEIKLKLTLIGLRLSYGTSQRLPRTITDAPLPYGEFVIPIGATVSMDNYAISHDETIFPRSDTFQPERWLNNATAFDGKRLSR